MPASLTYPGVYVEEIPSGVRTIVGVSTATTAFVGRARKGDLNDPTVIHSFTEYLRFFGDLWSESTMGFAVNQYFANGGGEAVIVRVFSPATGKTIADSTVTFTFNSGAGDLVLAAASPGSWATTLIVSANTASRDPMNLFNIVVSDGSGGPTVTNPPMLETIRNVSLNSSDSAFVGTVLEQTSRYLRFLSNSPAATLPLATPAVQNAGTDLDGQPIADTDIVPTTAGNRVGIYALEKTDIFNLLVLPPPAAGGSIGATQYDNAANYCQKRRAMLLVDPPPSVASPSNVVDATTISTIQGLVTSSFKKNAAAFFPFISMQNPLNPALIDSYPPSGAVAGVFSRTDIDRGVWKAPAGIDASVAGALGLTVTMTDDDNGTLNPAGINCLRTFPLVGSVVWGSRTMDGADALASEWKYIPVRRVALYIEESLYRGLKWVVFEPNDEPLWSQIRLNAGAFMNNLFRQGAFQGASPRDAYFVKCDKDTTTQNDINLGIVNVLVGFAPLKPAEFVVIKIQQIAGQVDV